MTLTHLRARAEGAESLESCGGAAVDLSNMGLRVGSIFIILAASALGAFAPIILHQNASQKTLWKVLSFIFKFFGSGVIIGTAWMHLLSPAEGALSDPCLEARLGEYDWAMAIAGMTLMVMVLVQVIVNKFGPSEEATVAEKPRDIGRFKLRQASLDASVDVESNAGIFRAARTNGARSNSDATTHENHNREPSECPSHTAFAGRLTAIFILEFGVVFHSIFIGLVLATTDELNILVAVLAFHQLFEGLGLGARLAVVRWGRGWRKLVIPYLLAGLFAISTPIGTGAGLLAKPSNHEVQLLLNGVFDAVSAGILMYTGVVELLGREFLFNPHTSRWSFGKQMGAYGCIALGFTVMTVLAKWA